MHPRMLAECALALIASAVLVVAACNGGRATGGTSADTLATGTWGGENAAAIVDDMIAHVHIGCTFGDFRPPMALDHEARFNVEGSYTLRAYPIAVGPSVPARFTGSIDGNRIVVTATIDDTVEKRTVVRGPVSLRLGVEPKLGPCPICRRPDVRRFGGSGVHGGLADFRTPEPPNPRITASTFRSPPSTTSAALPPARAAVRRSST